MKRLIQWHRVLGLAAAIFIINLAITGLLLNHSDQLKLTQHMVGHPLLMRLYGIPHPRPVALFRSDGRQLLVTEEQVYLNGRPLPLHPPLAGALLYHGLWLVASGNEIILLTADGELIDTVSTPAPIDAIGQTKEAVIVRGNGRQWRLDGELTALETFDTARGAAIHWSRPAPLPADPAGQRTLQAQLPGATLPLERVVLDLHSGRLFGAVGVLLFDLAALMMLALTVTGCWRWLKHQRTRRQTKPR